MDYDDRTALIVVDVQNDFADPNGSLYVPGGEEVVPAANAEIAKAKEAGALVVYTQDWHPPSTPHFQKDGGIWPVHCVMDTWGSEFASGLEVDGEIVRKGSDGEDGYSGFGMRDPVSGHEQSTGLAERLRERDINRVVVIGLALDYCVKETAIDAARHGFDAALLGGVTRAVNLAEGDDTKALDAIVAAGVEVA